MHAFLTDLIATAPAAGGGCYAFLDEAQKVRGWVQLIIRGAKKVEIHRLWTLQPGRGNGSFMLKAVCDIADRHGVEIVLKALPFGRKPYPMKGEQLASWYEKYGFVGTRRRMVRKPATPRHPLPQPLHDVKLAREG